jgi:hypothetical protein
MSVGQSKNEESLSKKKNCGIVTGRWVLDQLLEIQSSVSYRHWFIHGIDNRKRSKNLFEHYSVSFQTSWTIRDQNLWYNQCPLIMFSLADARYGFLMKNDWIDWKLRSEFIWQITLFFAIFLSYVDVITSFSFRWALIVSDLWLVNWIDL